MFYMGCYLLYLIGLNLVYAPPESNFPFEFPTTIIDKNAFKIKNDEIITIKSPGYPNPYPPNFNISYFISGEGKPLQVISTFFDLRPENDEGRCVDRLVAFDAKYPYTYEAECGSGVYRYLSYTDSLALKFTSGTGPIAATGFEVKISRTECARSDLKCPSDIKGVLCISFDRICDGVKDCPEGEDEICSEQCGRPTGIIDDGVMRVSGGKEAVKDAWPWYVYVRSFMWSSEHQARILGTCGGSLIAPQWVMTAGHCCFQDGAVLPAANFSLTMESLQCADNRTVAKRVSKVYPHPSFTKFLGVMRYDACLLFLESSVVFSSSLTPVCLPRPNTLPKPNQICFVAGCGRMNPTSPSEDVPATFPKVLLQTSQTVITNSLCHEKRQWYMNPEIMCGLIPGKDSCEGDSGGPLVCPIKEGADPTQWQLTGIVSFGTFLPYDWDRQIRPDGKAVRRTRCVRLNLTTSQASAKGSGYKQIPPRIRQKCLANSNFIPGSGKLSGFTQLSACVRHKCPEDLWNSVLQRYCNPGEKNCGWAKFKPDENFAVRTDLPVAYESYDTIGCNEGRAGVYARLNLLMAFVVQTVYREKRVGWLTDTRVPQIDHSVAYDDSDRAKVLFVSESEETEETDDGSRLQFCIRLFLLVLCILHINLL